MGELPSLYIIYRNPLGKNAVLTFPIVEMGECSEGEERCPDKTEAVGSIPTMPTTI